MPLRFNIRVRGKTIQSISADANKLEPDLKRRLNVLGMETLGFVKSYISGHKKRSQAGDPPKLENAMEITFYPLGWGIGEIDKLNKEAPHWYWINFGVAQSGRRIPPSTKEFPKLHGQFQPNANGRFKKGGFPIFPQKAITAMNYIENTQAFINAQIPVLFNT